MFLCQRPWTQKRKENLKKKYIWQNETATKRWEIEDPIEDITIYIKCKLFRGNYVDDLFIVEPKLSNMSITYLLKHFYASNNIII